MWPFLPLPIYVGLSNQRSPLGKFCYPWLWDDCWIIIRRLDLQLYRGSKHGGGGGGWYFSHLQVLFLVEVNREIHTRLGVRTKLTTLWMRVHDYSEITRSHKLRVYEKPVLKGVTDVWFVRWSMYCRPDSPCYSSGKQENIVRTNCYVAYSRQLFTNSNRNGSSTWSQYVSCYEVVAVMWSRVSIEFSTDIHIMTVA
jgi:hypothetical protein